MSFETIVASENNGAKIHYELCNDKLKKGFLVIDFGIKINEYCSDMTRTFYLGVPSSKEIEMYEKVRTVQDESIEKFKLNLTPFEIDTYVRQILGKEYIHSLGHGVGLDIHENPGISILNKEKIVENAVFTIEPGVYFENKYGIRIEDTVVKQKNTIKALTLFTKELIIIDCNKKIIDKKNV
jgi:Xaa-Pro aminopeptidase